MSHTEEVLSSALREASVLGEISLALAGRRYRPGQPERWARRLRAAAARLEALADRPGR